MKISKGEITYQVKITPSDAKEEMISKDQLAQFLTIITGANFKPLFDINPDIRVEIKKNDTTLIAITPTNT